MAVLHALQLWVAAHPAGFAGVLAAAFVLGVVHGITPDEHTWPITFSYAVGAYSTRRGLLAGLAFSLAFAAQRALGSELAYLSLGRWLQALGHDGPVYVVVGAAMAVAGAWVLRYDRVLHWDPFGLGHRHREAESLRRTGDREAALRPPTPAMALGHGFLAGWGIGAFALFLYTVLAPAAPGAAWAWMPGFAFGVGTAAVQAPAGALFGRLAARRGLTAQDTERIAHAVAGRTLFWGGLAFAAGGALLLAFPAVGRLSLPTPIPVPNLDQLGLGFALVTLVVVGIGLGSLVVEVRRVRRLRRT
jgi:hypothetical protein